MVYYSSGNKCPYDFDKALFVTAEQIGKTGTGLRALEAGKDLVILDNVCFMRKIEDKKEDED